MNRDVVLGEWTRSRRTLLAAELLAREGYPEDAIARSYYAILHAAKAALFIHDIAAGSHAGVRRLFGKHLILSGAIERECRRASEFIERIRRYLIENVLTDDDLGKEAGGG